MSRKPDGSANSDNGSGGMLVAPVLGVPATMPMDARTIKAHIFAAKNKVRKSKIVDFFGMQIEIRQPSIKEIFAQNDADDITPEARAADILIKYAFVPGTNEHVFDTTDAEQIASLPFGSEWRTINETFNDFIKIDVPGEIKNSVKANSASKSS